MSEELCRRGLIAPPAGFVSVFPSLSANLPLLEWDQIRAIAKSGTMDGRKKYDQRFVEAQRHNNCAGASAAVLVMKTIYDTRGEFVRLSNTFTYSLINGGRDQGSMLADACRMIQDVGVCTPQICGPDDIYPAQYDKKKAHEEAKRFRVAECYAIRGGGDRDLMWRTFWSALALGWKIGVAVQAGGRFDRLDSNGICGVDNGGGNHAVHVDGLVEIGGDLIATGGNTWPLSWGINGRMNMRQEHFVQTIGTHEFFAARTAVDDTHKPIPVLL